MASADWRDAERSMPSPAHEVVRLARRSRRRLGWTVAGAAFAAVLAAGMWHVREGQHEAEIVLRVSEGLIDDERGMPGGEIRGYVESALLTRSVLGDIIERQELFPAARERGEQAAIDALRDAIDVEIYGNFFAAWEGVGSRSLRIRITYRSGDRQEAAGVIRALADEVQSAELEERRFRFDEGRDLSQTVIARVSRQLDERQRELRDRLLELRRAEAQGDPVQAGALRLQASHLLDLYEYEQRMLRDALAQHRELDFRRAAARERLGILFTVVAEELPPPPPADPWTPLALVGGAMFMLSLPLSAVAAGAFDRRLHDGEDISRLGLDVVGHVPRFRGHALGARLRAGKGKPRSRQGL